VASKKIGNFIFIFKIIAKKKTNKLPKFLKHKGFRYYYQDAHKQGGL
jgi:hypothetical protein